MSKNHKYYQQHIQKQEQTEIEYFPEKSDIITRMQVDIERRKLEMDAKVQMKELEEMQELSKLFSPVLYPAPKRSKSRERLLA